MKDIKLSDGTVLSKGTMFHVSNPADFDGFRWANLGKRCPADANKHYWTQLTKQNMTFGYGKGSVRVVTTVLDS